MKLLVIGGTKFLGRHLVESAVGRGHEITLFNRGQTNPDLFPGAEKLHGDRDGELSALEGRSWEAAVDTCGYFPRIVRASAELLAGSVDHYTFISTISVYADLSRPVDETSPLGTIEDETVEELGAEFENYGPLKALCERAVEEIYGDRALLVRPGFIVGPHDPTDRFTYWPRRVAQGSRMIAPGPPDRPIQFIDVRDLANWILDRIEERRAGAFNATNQGLAMSEFLAACPGEAEIVWPSDELLVEHGVTEDDLPLWTGDPAFAALHETDVSAAVAAGLTFRPAADTARDTLEWDRSRGNHELAAGMNAQREAELLAAWEA